MVIEDYIERTSECNALCQGVAVPTEDELEALKAMRTIKDNVRDLKKKLSNISFSDSDESAEKKLELEKELVRLKAEWNEWEIKRREAARVRMLLLGHEEVS